MTLETASRRTVRFSQFEVDLDSGELRRDGARVPLGEQPTQVLLKLVSAPGVLVTRDELRRALWPAGTFVEDPEQGLNAAVKRLRDALDDHADEPRFIQTVPRRGYRFVGQFDGHFAGELPPAEAASSPPDPGEGVRRLAWGSRWLAAFAAAALALAVVGSIATMRLRRSDESGPTVRVTASRSLTEHSVTMAPLWAKIALVTNGPLLYFPESTDGVRTRTVPTAGGVSERPEFGLGWSQVVEAVSPDGSNLIVSTQPVPGTTVRPFWIVSAAGGAPRRLGSISGHCPLWLPDGRILYLKGFGGVKLCITDQNGTSERTVATFAGVAVWPRLSPDGTRVRLSLRNEDLTYAFVDVDLQTGKSRPVVFAGRHFEDACCGSWTPDGRIFVFEASHGIQTHLWAALEGSDAPPIQITQGPVFYHRPLPSPDGRRLFAMGRHLKGELVYLDRHTSRFVPHPLGLSARWVEFSRDGRWVAYVTYPEGDLWLAKSDGSGRLRLSRDVPVLNVHWSPDASTIVFNEVHGRDWRMVRLSRDGGGRLDFGVGNNPSWSPDGSAVAFSRDEGPESARGIYIRGLNSGSERLIPESTPFFAPRWSPDGRFIVVQDSRDMGLALYEVERQRWSRLVGGIAWFPTWAPDSSAIYYSSPSRGNETDTLYRVPLATRVPERIWKNQEMKLVWGPPPVDVPWTGLDAEGQPLLLREIETHDIYAFDLEVTSSK